MQEFTAGQTLVREGEPADGLFLILEGRAEVATAARRGPVPLATLGPGDLLGELALLSGTGHRQATVVALSDLRAVRIGYDAFAEVLATHPEAEAAFREVAERQLVVRFLKRASPFAALTLEQTHELAAKLARRAARPGEDIVRQGEEGDACYLLLAGKVEVRLGTADGGERTLATLGPGGLFGEMALLTQASRSATVRAAEPCDLLALRRDDFLGVVGSDADLGRLMLELVHLRTRPRRAEHVTAHPRRTPEGDTIVTLKDERRLAYYRLSPEGWFLWQRLDGDRTLKDLTLDYLDEYGTFAPDRIAATLAGLARAGFVVGPAFRHGLPEDADERGGSRAAALAAKVRGSLEWRLTLRDVDGLIGRLHDRGGRLLFTPAAAVALGALALAGLAAFVLSAGPARQGLQASSPAVLLFLYPATIVSVVLHELGHALATKAAGRRVNGAGVGWYWFGPVAFVDTSDMWLSGRRDRIAVSLAGPAVNAILGGAAALAGVFLSGLAQAVAWQFAFVSYAAVLINLNPLLEYDGYHVLTDLLDRPGLRRRALGWLGRNLPGALWRPDAWRQHATELAYGLASLLYVTGMVGFTAWLIRGFVEGRLAGVLTPAGAAALAWAAALLFALLVAAGLWRDLGPVGSRRPGPSAPASGRSGVGVGPAG